MFFITASLSISVFIVALAVLVNQRRARDTWDFELKPNCLLTRWPILFITGRRSLFYFSKYWNHYPSFLAEHGYEVFTLHLPWNKKEQRLKRMADFFKMRSEEGRRFHLVMDSETMDELRKLLSAESYSCVMSLTEICDRDDGSEFKVGSAVRVPWSPVEVLGEERDWSMTWFAFVGHRMFHKKSPSLAVLGGEVSSRHENALLLLERSQVLAETDLASL